MQIYAIAIIQLILFRAVAKIESSKEIAKMRLLTISPVLEKSQV